MKYASQAILLPAFLSILGACTTFGNAAVNAGDTEPEVIAKLGTPTHRYQDGQDHLLEYMRGPWGQVTYMARIGPDSKLISYQQVLTTSKFAALKPGQATREQVLHTIGAPSAISYLSLPNLEVWSYPYKESGTWNSVMYVHFDKTGIVRSMQNGPDLRFDPDAHWPSGL